MHIKFFLNLYSGKKHNASNLYRITIQVLYYVELQRQCIIFHRIIIVFHKILAKNVNVKMIKSIRNYSLWIEESGF